MLVESAVLEDTIGVSFGVAIIARVQEYNYHSLLDTPDSIDIMKKVRGTEAEEIQRATALGIHQQ